MKFFIKLLVLFTIFGINISFAAINLTVSPIKYEIESDPGTTITKIATLHNRWNTDIVIKTWKSDFIASWTDWSPTFLRYSELVHPDQQLSSWISLSSSWFTIPANSKKDITFTIDIPANATPGWHYGAVFFKNNNSESSSLDWAAVWINVDYWIIILLKVSWEIITDVVIDSNNITISGWNSNLSNYLPNSTNNWWYSPISKKNYNLVWNWNNTNIVKKDNCLLDFTNSRNDWKCFDKSENIIKIAILKEEKENINLDDNKKWENNEENKFNIWFSIPVKNKWNTHVKTTWKIKLFDEDWNQIKQIWKKIIVNKKWAIIWEKIVDYIPINDNNWNILPWTKRIFNPEWEGFPYKEYSQELWKEIIKYKNPWEFYTDKELKKEFRLMPWERMCFDKKNKKIIAKFDLSYLDREWKEVSFLSAQEFNIEYTRKYIWYNYYFIFLIIWILLFIFILFWIIWLLRKKNNKKVIKK